MPRTNCFVVVPLALLLVCRDGGLLAAPPRVLVEGVQLERVAAEPDLVTPIGVAFDLQGRLLVVESHTHQRPDDYPGPAGDRLRMLSDSDGDGRLDRWSTFAEGFQQAMNAAVAEDGAVYVVTRRDVHVLRDADGDGVADSDETIIRLVTEAEYPHNGLAGIALAPQFGDAGSNPAGGGMYLGLGENFGFPYQLVGSDGKSVSGRGGVGCIFVCRQDGGGLARYAEGFWNPFSVCLAPHGRVFTVDNDPDASPPCRLLHVVHAGDYGHRWEYGRAGVHPLQAWDGELPGTLPMVCGTGEAPTAVLAHRGWLWVTSWGDYRIERYRLTPRGASFGADREVVVQGDADFRPTGMAVAPDGSLWFADWVDRSYAVHGKGRLWRLTLPADADAPDVPENETETTVRRLAESLTPLPGDGHLSRPVNRRQDVGEAIERLLNSDDPFDRLLAWNVGAERDRLAHGRNRELSPRGRLAELQQAAWSIGRQASTEFSGTWLQTLALKGLADPDPDVRLYAVRLVARYRQELRNQRDAVAALLDGPIPDERYFLAVLGALDWLDGDDAPRHGGIGDGLLARELRNRRRSPELRALALRLISPDHKQLTLATLRTYLESPSLVLQIEAIRTLARQSNPDRHTVLSEIATDVARSDKQRAFAVAGLAAEAAGRQSLLAELAASAPPQTAAEAARVLRLAGLRPAPAEEKPAAEDLAAWNELLAAGGDVDAGERLFFTPAGPQCAACHQHGGRGGRVGPDLARIGRQQTRERIIASILLPGREIAPQYQAWTLLTDDGKSHLGLKLPQGGDNGQESYADPSGRTFTLSSDEIELRSPSAESIMPSGLQQTMSIADLRDLVAFLMSDSESEVDATP
ncbi:MAG: c-type cytochrome [Pirellulales bacterium]|nr:c-type cytochrome [Pirellulales bacterium]